MALRAGYYGLKRGIRNKLFNLLDAVPEGIGPDNPIAGKNDVLTSVDLLKDTTGWVGKNKLPNTAVSGANRGVDFTVNTDKSITANGTNDGSDQHGSDIYIFGNNARGQRKKVSDYLENSFVFSAGIEIPSTMNVAIWFYDSSDNYLTTIGIPTGAKEVEVTVPNNAVYFLPYVRVYKDQTVNNVTVYPMICSKEEYALDPTYEPYHESVDSILTEHKITINEIISAATDAADFTAFKSAMEAITPVTRSLSKEASPEEDPAEVIEEKTTKKTTKKTVKEGE